MKKRWKSLLLAVFVSTSLAPAWAISAAPVRKTMQVSVRRSPAVLQGTASWYSEKDPHIRIHTASGEVFDDSKKTCASWDFPFGTYLKVTNRKNGRFVVCRVNDRGPLKKLGRRIDLTKEAFRHIADIRLGLVPVSVMPIRPMAG